MNWKVMLITLLLVSCTTTAPTLGPLDVWVTESPDSVLVGFFSQENCKGMAQAGNLRPCRAARLTAGGNTYWLARFTTRKDGPGILFLMPTTTYDQARCEGHRQQAVSKGYVPVGDCTRTGLAVSDLR